MTAKSKDNSRAMYYARLIANNENDAIDLVELISLVGEIGFDYALEPHNLKHNQDIFKPYSRHR